MLFHKKSQNVVFGDVFIVCVYFSSIIVKCNFNLTQMICWCEISWEYSDLEHFQRGYWKHKKAKDTWQGGYITYFKSLRKYIAFSSSEFSILNLVSQFPVKKNLKNPNDIQGLPYLAPLFTTSSVLYPTIFVHFPSSQTRQFTITLRPLVPPDVKYLPFGHIGTLLLYYLR